MSPSFEQYPFVEQNPGLGTASLAAMLPILLIGSNPAQVMGLLDTGATVNVLPYTLGVQLGAVWEQQTTPITLSGNLATCEARALLLKAQVGGFAPVRLVFAWTRTDSVPLLLGQVNFFMEFDICFFRSRALFEVRPKANAGKQA
jgi:hypothetical protein